MNPEKPAGRAALLHLHAVAFVAGSAVMVLEILGTRIIGPVFGVTLFVWAALLAVTLASLAIGYYAGGVLVDRHPQRRTLGWIVIGAGVLVVFAAFANIGVLRLSLPLGPRLGPMLSAAVLFGPGLLALGMVTPVAIRLAADDTRITGHRVGSLSAISTAGSLIGTCVTGFLLVPSFDSRSILLATAAGLVLVGGLTLPRRRAIAVGAAVLLPFAGIGPSSAALPSGITVRAQAHSAYGLVQVIEDRPRNVRLLRSDHSIIGGAYLDDLTQSPFDYIDVLESIRCVRPAATHVLQIGLGTGTLATRLRAHQIDVDVVEIDPNVVRFAAQYFAFGDEASVLVEDARTWLQTAPTSYDVIVHDTFTGGATPEHLLSVEALRSVRKLLKPQGLLVLNFVGHVSGVGAEATWAVARTLREVFREVKIYRDDTASAELTNIVFFASDGSAAGGGGKPRDCAELLQTLASWRFKRSVPDGPLLTDEWNPLARLALPTADEHFAAMNKLLPASVWLNTAPIDSSEGDR